MLTGTLHRRTDPHSEEPGDHRKEGNIMYVFGSKFHPSVVRIPGLPHTLPITRYKKHPAECFLYFSQARSYYTMFSLPPNHLLD